MSIDIGTVISTAITTVGLIVVAVINLKGNKKIDNYHKEVNGKMGQLLEVTAQAGKAEGKLEERKANQEETDAKSLIK